MKSSISFVNLYILLSSFTLSFLYNNVYNTRIIKYNSNSKILMKSGDHDILVRAYKGEDVERTPVWLMRQAGRYMADFRKYSEKYPLRQRSETPEISI